MVQWTNLQRIKRFVSLMRLYISREKSGGLHLAEPGLTAGKQAGWLPKFRQSPKILKLPLD